MFVNPTTKENVLTDTTQVGAGKRSLVEDNVLHKFASYNYVLTLSALSRSQLDNPDKIPTDVPQNIIARTGGIGNPNVTRTIEEARSADVLGDKKTTKKTYEDVVGESQRVLNKGRDIYFNSVTIDSFPRPNEFRKLMNYTKIEMVLEEPNGITFWEKCRAAAFNSGYRNHTTAPFLITIEFKGYDDLGNEIPNVVPKRVYPVRLSKSSLQMNAGGTTYTVEAYPWTEFAMINAFLFTRGGGTVAGQSTIQDQMNEFARQLNNDIEDQEVGPDKLRDTADKYEITVGAGIGQLQSQNGDVYPTTGFFNKNRKQGSFKVFTYGKNQSIVKIIEDTVRQFVKYNDIEKILADKADLFTVSGSISEDDQYVDWFKIVTTVKEGPIFDKKLGTHNRIIHYHVKPFKIHVLNFVRAGFGFSFDYKNAVRKKFNYIYTGENLDILDLNVEYNAGYYQSILRKQDPNILIKILNKAKSALSKLIKTNNYEADPLLPLHSYVTTLNTENPSVDNQDKEVQENQALADTVYDYLVNPKGDMVNVDMKIMGDPAFLGQDYAIPLRVGDNSNQQRINIGSSVWDPQYKAFNFDNGEVVVQLDFKFPSDFDENEGLYKFNTEATPQFSGLYRVIRVESRLENGQFTQNLTMARCMNQQKITRRQLRAADKGGSINSENVSENVFVGPGEVSA